MPHPILPERDNRTEHSISRCRASGTAHRQREDAHTIWVKTHGLSTLKDDELTARLTELKPAADAENHGRGQRIYDALANKVAALRQQRRDDPAASVSDDPMVQDAAAALDANDPAPWRALVQARLAAQDAAGIPQGEQSPITRDEALTLTEPLRRVPPGEEGEALAEVTQRFDAMFGDHADRAFAEALRWSAADAATASAVGSLLRKIGLRQPLTRDEARSLEQGQRGHTADRARATYPASRHRSWAWPSEDTRRCVRPGANA